MRKQKPAKFHHATALQPSMGHIKMDSLKAGGICGGVNVAKKQFVSI
jgi:hypothetical protein